jgi:Txe/YoeB family toxin of Txe-Axe toxin-antitoxin module
MNENNKHIFVVFCDKKLESEFERLNSGRSEDISLYSSISKAISELKKCPVSGIKIQNKLWPKSYIQKYNINNLWKYDLPNGWRLIYTIKTDEVMILNIVLEWFSHREYERRFGY